MSYIKNSLFTLLFLLSLNSNGQESLGFALQATNEPCYNAFNPKEELYGRPYYGKVRRGSTGRTLRIIGVTAAAAGLGVVLLDYLVIKTPGNWLGDPAAIIAVTGGPLFTAGSIVRHFELYGRAGKTEMPAYASLKKQVSLGITRTGEVGLFIDL